MKNKHRASAGRYYQMLQTAFGAEICGYMADDKIIEIMLNPDGRVHIDHLINGKQPTDLELSHQQGVNIIKLAASCSNLVTDSEHPEVATELPVSHARFQGWLPPVVNQPCFAIRKHAKQVFQLDDYVRQDSLQQSHCDLIRQAIQQRKNIIVAGGTGSGKTTFTNALLGELQNANERILILEDLPELQVLAQDVVSMRTTDQVDMRMLVKGSLRMRPDRIIIGEVRDGAALDLLKAWNTGHPGGICTIHANSAEDAPYRIDDLLQEVVPIIPHRLVTRSIDLIIFIKRDSAGKRRVTTLAELTGFSNGAYKLAVL
jgi:type IV secretion system protein VirB11